MVPDITLLIAELVRQAIPGLDSRQEYQSEALVENICTVPAIGRLIDSNDVKYLMSALALGDSDFGSIFPNIRNLKKSERQELAGTLEDHFEQCGHCSRKRGYDLEWNERITGVCRENKDPLLELLEESKAYVPENNPQVKITTTDFNGDKAHGRPPPN